jgi:hypothetical protein
VAEEARCARGRTVSSSSDVLRRVRAWESGLVPSGKAAQSHLSPRPVARGGGSGGEARVWLTSSTSSPAFPPAASSGVRRRRPLQPAGGICLLETCGAGAVRSTGGGSSYAPAASEPRLAARALLPVYLKFSEGALDGRRGRRWGEGEAVSPERLPVRVQHVGDAAAPAARSPAPRRGPGRGAPTRSLHRIR